MSNGITFTTTAEQDPLCGVIVYWGPRDADSLLIYQRACEREFDPSTQQCKQMLYSSLDDPAARHDLRRMVAHPNGFVHAVLDAAMERHHLCIR